MAQGQINHRKILNLISRYKYAYLIILPLMLGAAYLYLETAQSKYESSALILINEDATAGHLDEEAIFAEFGLNKLKKNIENEMLMIKSLPAVAHVVRENDLQYNFVEIDGFKRRDLYKNSPIEVADWEPANPHASFTGKISGKYDGSYSIEIDEITYDGQYGSRLRIPQGYLTLTSAKDVSKNQVIELTVSPVNSVAEGLIEELDVRVVGERSSTIQLGLKDVVAQRAADIINGILNRYNKETVDTKNRVFQNTIDLINKRIGLISGELTSAESRVEQYKRSRNMVELSTEGSLLLNELAASNKDISGAEVELEILESIGEFLQENKNNFEFVPTNSRLTNLTLANQLTKFNELLREYEDIKGKLGHMHPDLQTIEKQVENFRPTIIENIKSIRKDLLVEYNAALDNKTQLEVRLKSLPKMERELIEMQRQKDIQEDLYLYLLQKREESAISLAVTTPTGTIIQPAEAAMEPIGPIKAQIWLIGIFLGIALPTGFAFIMDGMNDKIQFEGDITSQSPVPVVGVLGYTKKKKEDLAVLAHSRSAIAEMFRMLRANLAYVTPGKEIKSVLITSSISSEGKSFITLNLGMTQALSGKRTLILELDLRKPKGDVYKPARRAEEGVVNYLVDPKVTTEQIIAPSGLHPKLDIIGSGPKPPNPSELILSNRLWELVTEVRDQYDFIIIDAPPVGLVADALQIDHLADATMYVVRAGFTRKAHLEIINDINEKEKLPKPFIVLNGVNLNKPGGYKPGYGAQYGHGYGYYMEDKAKAFKKFKPSVAQQNGTREKTQEVSS